MAEDGGVLGNLPNSRPGKRSAKRDAAAGPKAARPRKRPTAVKETGSVDPVPPPASEDPVGAVVRTGASIVGAGVKVAEGITRELFRRLPRP